MHIHTEHTTHWNPHPEASTTEEPGGKPGVSEQVLEMYIEGARKRPVGGVQCPCVFHGQAVLSLSFLLLRFFLFQWGLVFLLRQGDLHSGLPAAYQLEFVTTESQRNKGRCSIFFPDPCSVTPQVGL